MVDAFAELAERADLNWPGKRWLVLVLMLYTSGDEKAAPPFEHEVEEQGGEREGRRRSARQLGEGKGWKHFPRLDPAQVTRSSSTGRMKASSVDGVPSREAHSVGQLHHLHIAALGRLAFGRRSLRLQLRKPLPVERHAASER